MSTQMLILFGVVALVVVGYFVYKKYYTYGDINIPMPAVLRDGIAFGYYGSLYKTWNQVKDNVNLYWYFNFYSREQFVREIKESKPEMKFVIDLAPFITEYKNHDEYWNAINHNNDNPDNKIPVPKPERSVLNRDAENRLREHFTYLRNEGVLNRINYLYPIDEPNLLVTTPEEHLKIIKVAKKVAAEFTELKNAKWMAIYVRKVDFWNIEEHDVVGVDNYDQKSEVLTKGDHARLMKAKLPHQTTIIVPGCGYGQNPDAFVAYAHTEPSVEIVAGFLWFEYDNPEEKDADFVGLEVRDEAFKEKWRQAGLTVMNKK